MRICGYILEYIFPIHEIYMKLMKSNIVKKFLSIMKKLLNKLLSSPIFVNGGIMIFNYVVAISCLLLALLTQISVQPL